MYKNKIIKSQDGKIEVQYDDVENVCVCMSHYALLQYLLLQEENVIKNTCFFFSEHINEQIVSKLPAVQLFIGSGIKKRISKISANLFSRIKYPFLRTAKIFAQDHGFPIGIIGGRNYSLLSDGPRFLATAQLIDTYKTKDSLRHSFRGFLESIMYGDITLYPMGIGNQCDEMFLTEFEDVPVCHIKKIHINSLEELWTNSSSSKKNLISYIFDVTHEDIQLLKSRPLMFMTQPISIDYGLTSDEYVQLLSDIFKKYRTKDIIVKLHPRDQFDYQNLCLCLDYSL